MQLKIEIKSTKTLYNNGWEYSAHIYKGKQWLKEIGGLYSLKDILMVLSQDEEIIDYDNTSKNPHE